MLMLCWEQGTRIWVVPEALAVGPLGSGNWGKKGSLELCDSPPRNSHALSRGTDGSR